MRGTAEARGGTRNRLPRSTVAIVLGLIVLGLIGLGGHPARAEVVFELVPDLALGVNDNTVQDMPPVRDSFATAGVGGHLRYTGARVTHALGNRLSYSHFFQGRSRDTLTDALTWTSTWDPLAVLQVRLSAGAAVSRVSSVDLGDSSAAVPTGAVPGYSYYVASTASEAVRFQPTARSAFLESLTAGRVDYLDNRPDLPTTTQFTGELRAERLAARDTIYLDARLSDAYTTTTPLNAGTFSEGHNLVAQLLLGWRRQLSAFWTSELQGGPMVVFRLNGDGIVSPSWLGSLSYQGLPLGGLAWFASLSVSRSAGLNLFLGQATVSDQALLRLALPLNRRQTIFVTGFTSYLYARQIGADAEGTNNLSRLFDQISSGAALTARMSQHPFFATLAYTFVDQRGSTYAVQRAMMPPEIRRLDDLRRRTLLLSAGAAFAWGPGTPTFFGGAP